MMPENNYGKKGKVIVVGAGVSGSSSAFRLHKSGFYVKLLEAQNRVGGKTHTIHKDGFMLERGGSIIPANYTALLGIINELGMPDQLCPSGSIVGFAKGREIHYLDSDHLFRDSAKTKLLSLKSKLLMVKILWDSMRIKKYLSYENLSTAASFDVETASQYGARLNDEIEEFIIDSTLRGMLGTSAETSSVVDFFFCFNKILGSKYYSLRNGLNSYTNKIAEILPDVQLNARVSQIEETPGRVQVTWTNHEGVEFVDEADACVIALNAHFTSPLFPQLDDLSHKFLKGLRYTSFISLNVALSKAPPNIPAFAVQFPRSVHPDLIDIFLEHNKAPHSVPPGKGALCIFASSASNEKLIKIKEDDDTVRDKMIAAVETVIPSFSNDIEFAIVNKFYPAGVYSSPGIYKELGYFIQRIKKHKRVKLAGDYFSSTCMNSSVSAGERAAREIIEQFT